MSMNSDIIILRQNNYSVLINKAAPLDNDDFDANFINVYKDLEALNVTNSVDAYNASTIYDNAVVQFATFGGRCWQWINASAGSGVTPVDGIYWIEVFPIVMAHRKNSDTILAEGTANEVTAADIKAFISAGLTTTTNLAVTTKTSTSLKVTSSTGTDATLEQATQLLAGLLSAADKSKIDQLSGTNTGDQSLASLGAEASVNKATDFSTVNDILFPTIQAVDTYISALFGSGGLDTQLSINESTGANNISIDNGQTVNFNVGSGGVLNSVSTAESRNWSLPDATGTVALLSDIPAASPSLAVANQTITDTTRKIIHSGALSSNELLFRNSADTNTLLGVLGDGQVYAHGVGSVVSNTSIGKGAMLNVTTAYQLTAIGVDAIGVGTGGFQNVAIGNKAYKNGTGNKNVVIGVQAGLDATSVLNSVFVGFNAGTNVTTGDSNTFLGYQAGLSCTVAADNIIVGNGAGAGLIGGGTNIFIGHSADPINAHRNTIIGGGVIVGLANVNNQAILADGAGIRAISKDTNNNVFLGDDTALATTATNGFQYCRGGAGIPTGVPATAITGHVPMYADYTNNKLYIYSGGAWVALN